MPPVSIPVPISSDDSCAPPSNYAKDHWRKACGEKPALTSLIPKLGCSLFKALPGNEHSDFSLAGIFPLDWTERLWLETAQRLIDCENGKRNKKLAEKTKAFRDALSLVTSKESSSLCEDQKRAIDILKNVVMFGYKENLDNALNELPHQFPLALCAQCDTYDVIKEAAEDLCLAKQAFYASGLVKHILDADKHYRYYVAQALKKKIALVESKNAQLDVEVDCKEKNKSCEKCIGCLDNDLKKLRDRFYVIIGAQEEAKQEEVLLTFLGKDIQHNSAPGKDKASAIDEFNAARFALVEVRKAIAEKENKIKPPAAQLEPAKTIDNVYVLTITQDNKPEPKQELADWVRSKVEKDEPEFVIVLERGFTAGGYAK